MLKNWLKFLTPPAPPDAGSGESAAPKAGVQAGVQAAAGLLVRAARIDGGVVAAESAVVARLVEEGLGVPAASVGGVVAAAEAEEREASDLFRWTRQVNESFSEERKVALLEMLWEVSLSDGAVDDYESNLLRRVAGLLYVPDREAGEARQRVLLRLARESAQDSAP